MGSTEDHVEQASPEGTDAPRGTALTGTALTGTALTGTALTGTALTGDASTDLTASAACDLPVAPWHPGWTWRHLLVAALGAMAGWVFYGDLAVNASGLGWVMVLGLLSVAVGLVVASYLPRAGERARAPRDLCAYSPLMMLLAAGFFLTIAEGSLWGASPAVVLAAAAVLRRTTGASTCSV